MNERFKGSFSCALKGLWYTITHERNMKVHLFCAFIVILLGIYCELIWWKWAVLLLTISSVLAAETINTAIETCVDICCKEYNPLAQRAKDIAAGAVLITALMAVLIGIIIFIM